MPATSDLPEEIDELSQPEPEPGAEGERHGRDSSRPWHLTFQGWKDIVRRVGIEVKADNVPLLSAGVAFYAMLAIFPAVVAVVSIYGLVASPEDVSRQLASITSALPPDAATLVVGQARDVASASDGGLGLGLAIGIIAALWSASSGMKWLMSALTLAYDEKETRKFLKLRAEALLLTFAAALGLVIMFGLIAGMPAIFRLFHLGSFGRVVTSILRWPLLAALIIGGLATLYRYGPNREKPKWRWVNWGSVVAAILWLLASVGLSVYGAIAGNFDNTYGAIAGVVVLMLWLFVSVFAIMLGAELNAEMEHQTALDSTGGEPEPRGERGAIVADEIGEAVP